MIKFIKREIAEFKKALTFVSPVVLALYVAVLISMNLLANKEIYTGNTSEWLVIDCGTTLSWVMFFLTNIIVKKSKPKYSIRISLIAIIITLFFFVWYSLISYIPGNWGAYYEYNNSVANSSLNYTMRGSWRIILSSALAFFISISFDSVLNYSLFKKFKQNKAKGYILSNYISTGLSQFLDNLIFSELVSVGLFGWSQLQCVVSSLTTMIVELMFEIIFSAVSYKIYKKGLNEEKRRDA